MHPTFSRGRPRTLEGRRTECGGENAPHQQAFVGVVTILCGDAIVGTGPASGLGAIVPTTGIAPGQRFAPTLRRRRDVRRTGTQGTHHLAPPAP